MEKEMETENEEMYSVHLCSTQHVNWMPYSCIDGKSV